MASAGGDRLAGSRSGRLLVVGTPIGNLGDLSPRATAALRDSDLVVAEDTRVAARLLSSLGLRRPTISFNDHNANARLPVLVGRLAEGQTLALTTDAGMPAVSDPGARLVAAARDAGARIEVVPGPSAESAAFAVSGVEASGFLFAGFLPARPASARRASLERSLDAGRLAGVPLVLFESTHRIRPLLRELTEVVPSSRVVVCRELTKLHEQIVAGTPSEADAQLVDVRGEFVVVVDVRADGAAEPRPAAGEFDLAALVTAGRQTGIGDRTLVELLRAMGVSRRDAYRLVHGCVD